MTLSNVRDSRPVRKLNDKHRIRLIHWLAEFVPIAEVVQRIKDKFGIEITDAAVHYYAPPNVPEKWKTEFDRHRAVYLADIDSVDLRHRKLRLQELVKLYREIEWHDAKILGIGNSAYKDPETGEMVVIREKEIGTAAKILEQIAKEVGDHVERKSITDERKKDNPMSEMSDEELLEISGWDDESQG